MVYFLVYNDVFLSLYRYVSIRKLLFSWSGVARKVDQTSVAVKV